MSLIGRKVLQYQIRALLGAGGMGEVYEAYDPMLDKRVAVKVLHSQFAAKPDYVARFESEAVASTHVRNAKGGPHENVVDVIGRDVIDGRLVIVMEYLDGSDLEAWLQGRERGGHGPLAVDDVARIVLQILYALDAAHRCGIVHRDLKPQNVFMVADAQRRIFVKLLDFGIAKIASHLRKTGMLTAGPMGTWEYMAPEQARDASGADARADIWAMGCILYRVLTGRMTYALADGDTYGFGLRERQAAGEVPPPPSSLRRDLDQRWDTIVERCLAFDRENRFQSARQVAEAILDAIDEDGPVVFAESWPGGFMDGPDAATVRNAAAAAVASRSRPSAPPPVASGPTSVGGAAGEIQGTAIARAPRWLRRVLVVAGVGALVATILAVSHRGGPGEEAAVRPEPAGHASEANAATSAVVVVDAGMAAVASADASAAGTAAELADAAPIAATIDAADAGVVPPDRKVGVAPSRSRRSRAGRKPAHSPARSSVDAGVRVVPDVAPPGRRFDPDSPVQ